MTEADSSGTRRNRLGVAGWAAIYLGVASATLPAVLPVMVGVLADKLGFGVVRAGYVASANLGGVALGSLLCAAAVRRWSWQTLIKAGATTMIAANLLTTLAAAFALVASLRFVAGLGEGVIAALCYAAMSRSGQPARALAFYVAGQGLIGAFGMGLIPGIVATAGWPWLFVIVSVVALPAFWMARSIETLRAARDARDSAVSRPIHWAASGVMACILLYFIGMSAVWAFSERMGAAKSIDVAHLSVALSSSAIANMAGSLLVGFIAHRLSTLAGLAIGLSVVVAALLGLIGAGTWQTYLAAVSLFFFAWGFYFPFQFRLLAAVDVRGRMAALIPLVTGGGLTVGPAVGGLLLAWGGTTLVCAFGIACAVASSVGASTLYFNSQRDGALA